MYHLKQLSPSIMLSVVFTIEPTLCWAGQPSKAEGEHVITVENYHDVIGAIRKGRCSDSETRSAVYALVDIFVRSGDTQILKVIADLHAKNPSVLDKTMSRLVEVIENAPSERVICDLCGMFILFDNISPSIEKAIEARFSQTAPTETPTFSRIQEAAVILKFSGDAIARDWLEANCGHKQRHVRVASAHALGSVGKLAGEKSAARLQQLLDDPSAAVRTVSAEAIWKLTGNSEAIVSVLVAALREPGEAVILRPTTSSEWGIDHRHLGVSCLGQIGTATPAVIDGLIPLLRDKDPMLRVLTIRALGELGDQNERVRQSLQEHAEDGDPAISSEAVRVLRLLSK